jgi:phage/plasmid-associated DNA primase
MYVRHGICKKTIGGDLMKALEKYKPMTSISHTMKPEPSVE